MSMTPAPHESEPKWVTGSRNFGQAFAYLWRPLCWSLGAIIALGETSGVLFLGVPVNSTLIVFVGTLVGAGFIPVGQPPGPPREPGPS